MFYFHSTGGLAHRDDEGVELPDRRAAEVEGLRVLGELLKDAADWLSRDEPVALQVTEDDGREILRLEVTAMRPQGQAAAR